MRHLRRKLTVRAHGDRLVLVKRKQERIEHVWMKAFLWALYRPPYPDLGVEIDVGDTYKPDVVAMNRRRRRPTFWGEAGHVGPEKIDALVTRHPDTHLAFAKWDNSLDHTRQAIEAAVHDTTRRAPIDLIRFPPGGDERFLDAKGRVSVSWDELHWIRVGNAAPLG